MALPLLPLLIGAGVLVVAASAKPRSSPKSAGISGSDITEMILVIDDSRAAPAGTPVGPTLPGATDPEAGSTARPNQPALLTERFSGRIAPPGQVLPGHWVDLNTMPENFWADFWFKSDPRGVLGLKVKDNEMSFLWNIFAEPSMWPKKSGGVYRVKLKALTPWLGPEADWERLKGSFKSLAELAGATLLSVLALVGTSGMAAVMAAAAASGAVASKIASSVDDIKDPSKAALTAAKILIVDGYMDPAWSSINLFNPHLREFVSPNAAVPFSVGKKYMADPKTTADLRKPGNSRPWVYVPSGTDVQTYFGDVVSANKEMKMGQG